MLLYWRAAVWSWVTFIFVKAMTGSDVSVQKGGFSPGVKILLSKSGDLLYS